MFNKLIATHKNSVHFSKVSSVLKFQFGINAHKLLHITRPDLLQVCIDAREKNANIESTVVFCLVALVIAIKVDSSKIAVVGIEFIENSSIVVAWVEQGLVSPFLFTEYSKLLEDLAERLWGNDLDSPNE